MRAEDGLYANFRWGLTGELQEMLVRDRRVTARESSGQIRDPRSEIRDLAGKFLLPSFIDAHCHILPTGLDLQKVYLGGCSTKQEILDAVRDANKELPPDKWLLAVHYDQTKFPDNEHLTCDELDTVSGFRPALLRHVSGHASVANSAALRAAGIDESIEDPVGSTFRRDASGKLDGVLLEHAHERVTEAVPDPTLEEMVNAILLAGDKMAELGIACASDMMTGRFNLRNELEAYRLAAERGCKIRTRLYVQWSAVFGPRAMSKEEFEEAQKKMNPDICRVAGIKIFADGAIGSATAAIYGRFSGQPINPAMIISKGGQKAAVAEREVDGQLMYAPDRLKKMVRTAHDAGLFLAIHSIGDYSTDLVMESYEQLDNAKHHRIEHAMILSDAQIERMAKLGCKCTMQPEFLMRFAHSYRKQLGPERAAHLKRARSVIDAGIPLSFNSDRPIVAGDPMDGIRTIVRRPEGFDPRENVTIEEALLGYTKQAAFTNDDSDLMGSLESGQLADFQVFDQDPRQF
jgi:predicted amidohydrolase YtcJ